MPDETSDDTPTRSGRIGSESTDISLREYIAEQFRSHNREHVQLDRAITLAVASMDKRLDQMNEFRSQLADQVTTFARKESVDALDSATDRRFEELRGLIATEREERRANEGIKRGMGQTTTVIVAAIGLVGTMLGIVIILANVLTTAPK